MLDGTRMGRGWDADGTRMGRDEVDETGYRGWGWGEDETGTRVGIGADRGGRIPWEIPQASPVERI
jgi:hypothetical protein